jgi:hypothetical protein
VDVFAYPVLLEGGNINVAENESTEDEEYIHPEIALAHHGDEIQIDLKNVAE